MRTLTAALPAGPECRLVLLSAQMAPIDRLVLADAWRQRARWLSSRSDPRRLQGTAVLGLVPWARRHGLSLDEEPLLAEVYAATYFFNDALARMRGVWNRDYLAETLEQAVDNRPAGGAFFGLSLAAGQRVAAKGGHLLGYVPPDFATIAALSPRIVP